MIQIRTYKKRYTATVRRLGISVSLTFSVRSQAETWAKYTSREIERLHSLGLPVDKDLLKRASEALKKPSDPNIPNEEWTIAQGLDLYKKEFSAHKKGWKQEFDRIELIKAEIGHLKLNEFKPENARLYIKSLKNKRNGKELTPMTKRQYAFVISSLYKVASLPTSKDGWNLDLVNPIRLIQLPAPSKTEKTRRISNISLGWFFDSFQNSLFKEELELFYKIAVFTGMRRSEIIKLKYSDFENLHNKVNIVLHDTKSGYSRKVYLNKELSEYFMEKFANWYGDDYDVKVFSISADFASSTFKKGMTKAGLPNARLHDLRHEALSRMAENGFSLKELMSMSGHRTASVASKYLHVNEESIREKLDKIK